MANERAWDDQEKEKLSCGEPTRREEDLSTSFRGHWSNINREVYVQRFSNVFPQIEWSMIVFRLQSGKTRVVWARKEVISHWSRNSRSLNWMDRDRDFGTVWRWRREIAFLGTVQQKEARSIFSIDIYVEELKDCGHVIKKKLMSPRNEDVK